MNSLNANTSFLRFLFFNFELHTANHEYSHNECNSSMGNNALTSQDRNSGCDSMLLATKLTPRRNSLLPHGESSEPPSTTPADPRNASTAENQSHTYL